MTLEIAKKRCLNVNQSGASKCTASSTPGVETFRQQETKYFGFVKYMLYVKYFYCVKYEESVHDKYRQATLVLLLGVL